MKIHRAALIGALLLSAGPAASAIPDAVATVVEDFHASLTAVMKDAGTLGVTGRYATLEVPIDRAFDLERMIRVATGSSWQKASESQKERLVAAFRRLSVATYAAQFDGYSGQVFENLGVRPGPQQTRLVATRIVEPGEDSVDITYVMKETGGRWLIADVLLDNSISQLAVRRSEYRRVLATDGVDGLIATLNAKADDLLSKP